MKHIDSGIRPTTLLTIATTFVPICLRLETLSQSRVHCKGVTFMNGRVCDSRFSIPQGHTDGSVTYLVEVAGRRVAFTGDLIAAPGQIWEIYSLQKRFPGMRGGYWGFGDAIGEIKYRR